MKQLSRISGFLPYLLVVFLNAFVDLGHKIVIQNTIFKTWDNETQVILTAVINGLILLPFILLFSPSGFLADKYSKQKVMQYGALAAVGGTLLITVSYFMGWFWVSFLLTLLLSIQSAIYSPAKYGYIRELVGDEKLAHANGLVQATTIISILAGTFVFSALFEYLYQTTFASTTDIMQAIAPLGFILVALSLVEWITACRMPQTPAGAPEKTFNKKAYLNGHYLKQNLAAIRSSKAIWLSIIGLSVFWAISQVVLAAFPAFAKSTLAETNTVVIQGLLAATGVGIMLGSLIAGRLSRSYIELGLIPVGALGITLCLWLLPSLDSTLAIATLFLILGLSGGFFIIPLNALIQYSAHEDELGTVLAGNNWMQNIAMMAFLALTVLFSLTGLSSTGLFYLLAITALIGSVYTVKQLPHSLARIVAGMVLKRRYRISVAGFDNMPKHGGVLLLGNHISWLDWAMVQIACPRPVRFVMLRSIYDTWYLKPFLKAFGAIPISAGNSRDSLQRINACLKNGDVVCLFPEGAISRNGHLGEFKSGYERTIEGVDGVIVPFYLRGLWGSKLSRSFSSKLRENTADGLKRSVIVAFGEPLPINTPTNALKQKVFELSISAWDEFANDVDPLPLAWLKQAKKNLSATSIIDTLGGRFNNLQVIAGTTLLAKKIRSHSPENNIGIILPTSSVGIMTNLAVMLNGQTAVNLNFSTGTPAVQAAITNAHIQTVYTSSRFAEKLAKKGIDLNSMLQGARIIYLEDIKPSISKTEKVLHAISAALLPASVLYRLHGQAVTTQKAAQILFSSGSEGTPKGIMLSHTNLMGNIKQISDVLNTHGDDVMVASLPLFHSFGLTVNSLLPMVEGFPTICHPDPTDVLNVAKAIARYKGTILCGTATFLRLYTRNSRIQPLMLNSLRIIVSGAEKLTEEVRNDFELKFKKSIYEGYGATETTPVASVNVPDTIEPETWKVQTGQKPGTVGMPLPGTCFRIVDPETYAALPIGEDGLILISGGQVMLGYLNDAQRTQEAIIELDGRRWYKTGDKGHLDEDGFLTIVDRYSRFAKIGGEMISLSAVENIIQQLLPSDAIEIAATNLKDDKKGEKIVLLATGNIDASELKKRFIESGTNPLFIPSHIILVNELPKLGSGKTDYSAIKKVAQAEVTAA